MSSALGQRWGNYVLEEKIAAGGMAEVFRARRLGAGGFSKVVCIKRMHQHLSADQEFIGLFLDEARTGAKLRHRNIVTIDDLGEHEGQYFIAMEFVHGVDLAAIETRVRGLQEPFAANAAVYIAMEVLAGLAAAHRATDPEDGAALRVVHRDVAPHNILVSFAGEVKLGDFGIARAERRAQVTSGSIVRGRFGYMPLEQLSGAPIDQRADLFALGVVLFEMLAGQRPFLGTVVDATLEGIIAAQVTDRRPPLKTLRADLSDDLCAIVDTLLAKEPDERFQSAEVALTVLERVAERAGGPQALSVMMGQLFPSQASVAVSQRVSLPSITPTQPQGGNSLANATPTEASRGLSVPAPAPAQAVASTDLAKPRAADSNVQPRVSQRLELVTDKSDPLTKPFGPLGPIEDHAPAAPKRSRSGFGWPVIFLAGSLVFGTLTGGIAWLKSTRNHTLISTAQDAGTPTSPLGPLDVLAANVSSPPEDAVELVLADALADDSTSLNLRRNDRVRPNSGETRAPNTPVVMQNAVQNIAPTGRGVLRIILVPTGSVSIDHGPLSEEFENARNFNVSAGTHHIRATGAVSGERTVSVLPGQTLTVSFH